MKATGIVRRIDDLGRIVIPKEIRRTLRIREGELLLTTLTPFDRFCIAIHSVVEGYKKQRSEIHSAVSFSINSLTLIILFFSGERYSSWFHLANDG